jgi:hypothetical protein
VNDKLTQKDFSVYSMNFDDDGVVVEGQQAGMLNGEKLDVSLY